MQIQINLKIRPFFQYLAQSVAAFTAVARSAKRATRRRLKAFRSSLPLRRVEQSKLKERTGKRGPLNSVFVTVTTSHYLLLCCYLVGK